MYSNSNRTRHSAAGKKRREGERRERGGGREGEEGGGREREEGEEGSTERVIVRSIHVHVNSPVVLLCYSHNFAWCQLLIPHRK